MSQPSPESYFELLGDKDHVGYIGWNDGHSVGGETIQEAIDLGFRHFYTAKPEDYDFYILCYREPASPAAQKRDALKIVEDDGVRTCDYCDADHHEDKMIEHDGYFFCNKSCKTAFQYAGRPLRTP